MLLYIDGPLGLLARIPLEIHGSSSRGGLHSCARYTAGSVSSAMRIRLLARGGHPRAGRLGMFIGAGKGGFRSEADICGHLDAVSSARSG